MNHERHNRDSSDSSDSSDSESKLILCTVLSDNRCADCAALGKLPRPPLDQSVQSVQSFNQSAKATLQQKTGGVVKSGTTWQLLWWLLCAGLRGRQGEQKKKKKDQRKARVCECAVVVLSPSLRYLLLPCCGRYVLTRSLDVFFFFYLLEVNTPSLGMDVGPQVARFLRKPIGVLPIHTDVPRLSRHVTIHRTGGDLDGDDGAVCWRS